MKRLGIFLCYDKDGIIDDYITYLLDDIVKNLDELCIVSNGDLTDESIEKLDKYTTSDIIFRSNEGFDAGAWRDVMVKHYGFDNLLNFDEIILFNDSFFGPVYPFKKMFEKMDKKDIDFWGITNHGEALNNDDLCPYENRPRYIQTYFLAFRKNLVKSNVFQKYWKKLPDYEEFKDLAYKHEAVLTKYFEENGYKWESYVNTEDLEEEKEKALSLHTYDMHNLVAYRGLPIIKRKAFKNTRKGNLKHNLSSELSKTMSYLKENTDYDVSLIYKYLLRIQDPGKIVENLNLVRIFPKTKIVNDKTDKKVLVLAHLYYDDIWDYAFDYLKNIPDYVDILITTDSYNKKEFFEKNIANNLENDVKVLKIEARGRDMASLLVASRDIIKNYDYFCFMHDKKSQGKEYITIGSNFRDALWENNLASQDYIEAIINEFDDNPSLGVIVPPRIYHGTYFHAYLNDYWVVNYDIVLSLLNQMGIKTPISKKIPPLSIGNCFWARYDALEPLFDLYFDYNDFPNEPMPGDGTISHALERIYGYVAASRGYYSEIVMTEEYGRSEMFNFNYMLTSTMKAITSGKDEFLNYGTFITFYRLLKQYMEDSKVKKDD